MNHVNTYSTYQNCIEACTSCAMHCIYCASSCTKEDNVMMMSRCIQLDLECAAICRATAELLSLGGQQIKEICQLCEQMCNVCADECSKHKNQHCLDCANACKRCVEACKNLA